jgi:hypothetical protein
MANKTYIIRGRQGPAGPAGPPGSGSTTEGIPQPWEETRPLKSWKTTRTGEADNIFVPGTTVAAACDEDSLTIELTDATGIDHTGTVIISDISAGTITTVTYTERTGTDGKVLSGCSAHPAFGGDGLQYVSQEKTICDIPAGEQGVMRELQLISSASLSPGTIVSIYIDGADTPQVEVPIAALCLQPRAIAYSCENITQMTLGGFNVWGKNDAGSYKLNAFVPWDIPFSDGIKITLKNDPEQDYSGWYYCGGLYHSGRHPKTLGRYRYFHAARNIALICDDKNSQAPTTELLSVTGKGVFAASAWYTTGANALYTEGDPAFTVDGEETIRHSGMEDFGGNAYFFAKGVLVNEVTGTTYLSGSSVGFYRIYKDRNPIRFEESLVFNFHSEEATDMTLNAVHFYYTEE